MLLTVFPVETCILYDYNINFKNTITNSINDSIFLPSGEYFVVIDDTVFNCNDSLFFSINSVCDVKVDLDVNHVNCYGDSTGYINVDGIYGGSEPYNIIGIPINEQFIIWCII